MKYVLFSCLALITSFIRAGEQQPSDEHIVLAKIAAEQSPKSPCTPQERIKQLLRQKSDSKGRSQKRNEARRNKSRSSFDFDNED